MSDRTDRDVSAVESQSDTRPGRHLDRRLLVAGVLGLIAVSAFVYVRYFHHYVGWRIATSGAYVRRVPLSDIRFCACRPDQEVRVERSDGVEIAAGIYGLDNDRGRPWIILLHGNTPYGKRLPLYRVLSTRLAERGYFVLAIDFAGFGGSDDPFVSTSGSKAIPASGETTLDVWFSDSDVVAAIEYLVDNEGIKHQQAILVGHSGGAVAAMSTGSTNAHVANVIAIGPPRRTRVLANDPDNVEYSWQRAQRTRMQVYGKRFPEWYTRDLWNRYRMRRDIENYVDYYSEAKHKPLLLIDGALEPQLDLDYLRDFASRISEPRSYVTIKGADHYSNVVSFFSLCVYDDRVMRETVGLIHDWITRH